MSLKVMLDIGAYLPMRAHKADAGLDLRAMETKHVPPGGQVMLDTGVHIAIPAGFVGLLTSRSSLMKQGITCRGTIDSGYTGSIRAILFNHGSENYEVCRGDKITQLVILPCLTDHVELVDRLDDTERGTGGFGSTGRA